MPIAPHGGTLVHRLANPKDRDRILGERPVAKTIRLSAREVSILECIATGVFSPLTGFMRRADYLSVVDSMRLANGLVWTIPVTLSVSEEARRTLKEGDRVGLSDEAGERLGVIDLEEIYPYDKEREADEVYGTTEAAHPGVAALKGRGSFHLGGEVWMLKRPPARDFQAFRLDPADTRSAFQARGWKRVVGFQTRNPVHRAHEYIQKCALEVVDGLLLHPLVGETKRDDIPAAVRMKAYEVLFERYYPKDRVMLGVFPAPMHYAGPREAIFHALCRKNYGCTHFIVGRDHAGVGKYYGSFDAHYIFDEFEPGEIGITPLFFDHTFYCRACFGMASYKTCPHDSKQHVILSGTEVRDMLGRGEALPPEFTRPEIAEVLIEGMRQFRDYSI